MKGKDTRGYPCRGDPPADRCNWLTVNFDKGEKPDYLEKNPRSQIEIDWNSAHIRPWGQGWTRVTKVEGMVDLPLNHPDSPLEKEAIHSMHCVGHSCSDRVSWASSTSSKLQNSDIIILQRFKIIVILFISYHATLYRCLSFTMCQFLLYM